jgi:iron complex outermembrane receptor protein
MMSRLGIGSALCAALLSSAANAQQVPVGPQSSSPAEATQEDGVGDIVVTARRRDERLQDVPISITAIDGDQLTKSGITNTRELTQSVPALNFRSTGIGTQPVIRGVGSRGTSPGDESNVAIYVDGVYQAAPTAGTFELLNVERIEVLRGPQGTLFGRNATGGLINVVTKAPSFDPTFRARLRYGSFNERSAQAYGSVGLTDNLAFDLGGQYYEDDGYYRDIRTGKRTAGKKSYSLRSRLFLEPTSGSSLTLTAAFTRNDDPAGTYLNILDGNTSARALANDPNVILPVEPYRAAPSFRQRAVTEVLSVAGEVKVDLGAVTLQNTMAYERSRYDSVLDPDATPFDLGSIRNYGTSGGADKRLAGSDYMQNELRILSNGSGPFSYILGAFIIHGRAENGPAFVSGKDSGPASAVTVIDAYTGIDSIAGFGEVTLEFAPGWKATAGARYTSETRSLDGQTTRGGTVLTQIRGADATFSKLTYRAIVQRDIGASGNIYASYSRGFKSGVYNSFSTSPTTQSTRPEVLDAFELGIKTSPTSWLRANASAYYYDYKDIQLSSRDPVTGLAVLFNAADSRIKGAEFELTARATRNLSVRAFGTYTDAVYTNFPGAQIFEPIYQDQTAVGGSALTPIGNRSVIADVSGSRLIRTPKYTVGGSVDYSVEVGDGTLGATANLFHSARFYWDVNNRVFQPSYTLLNGEISYSFAGDRFRVAVWGKNLTDELVMAQANSANQLDSVTYDRPRTFGVSLDIKL